MGLWLAATLAPAGATGGGPATAPARSDAAKKARMWQLYRGYRKQIGSFPEVSVARLQALRRKHGSRVVVVDVRDPRERRVSTIPGAIPLSRWKRRAGQIVVAYCTIGARSGMLARKLSRQGVAIYNLAGSILAWVHAGGRLERGGKPVRRLHVYGEEWDLAPRGIETVW